MSVSSVWQEIKQWPPEEQWALASRILEALGPNAESPSPPGHKEALTRLIGIWRIDEPPGDDAVDRILEEERMKKYS
jgi:hypothetical protein